MTRSTFAQAASPSLATSSFDRLYHERDPGATGSLGPLADPWRIRGGLARPKLRSSFAEAGGRTERARTLHLRDRPDRLGSDARRCRHAVSRGHWRIPERRTAGLRAPQSALTVRVGAFRDDDTAGASLRRRIDGTGIVADRRQAESLAGVAQSRGAGVRITVGQIHVENDDKRLGGQESPEGPALPVMGRAGILRVGQRGAAERRRIGGQRPA